jgi:hypothetical protein
MRQARRGRCLLVVCLLSFCLIAAAVSMVGDPKQGQSIDAQQQPLAEAAKTTWPYRFVRSKSEESGKNVMDLYAYDGPLNADELAAFCMDRKVNGKADMFYIVVIFGKETDVRAPKSPVTATYDDEPEVLKTIRAIYVHNRQNGFSELTYHENNVYDGDVVRKKL